MKVNTVGYYKEMSEVKADANTIFDYIHKEEPENIEKICKYPPCTFAADLVYYSANRHSGVAQW